MHTSRWPKNHTNWGVLTSCAKLFLEAVAVVLEAWRLPEVVLDLVLVLDCGFIVDISVDKKFQTLGENTNAFVYKFASL